MAARLDRGNRDRWGNLAGYQAGVNAAGPAGDRRPPARRRRDYRAARVESPDPVSPNTAIRVTG
jgi:hypothetical protein